MNTLPTYEEIKKWDDNKLLSVIHSGESINWNCRMNESKEEFDWYVESVYSELEVRNRRFNKSCTHH